MIKSLVKFQFCDFLASFLLLWISYKVSPKHATFMKAKILTLLVAVIAVGCSNTENNVDEKYVELLATPTGFSKFVGFADFSFAELQVPAGYGKSALYLHIGSDQITSRKGYGKEEQELKYDILFQDPSLISAVDANQRKTGVLQIDLKNSRMFKTEIYSDGLWVYEYKIIDISREKE